MIVYNVDLVFNSWPCIEPNLHAIEKYQIATETYANLSHVIMIRRNCDGDGGDFDLHRLLQHLFRFINCQFFSFISSHLILGSFLSQIQI